MGKLDDLLKRIIENGILVDYDNQLIQELNYTWQMLQQLANTRHLVINPYQITTKAFDKDAGGYLVDLNKIWLGRN